MNTIFASLQTSQQQRAGTSSHGMTRELAASAYASMPVIDGCDDTSRLKTYLEQRTYLVIDDSGSMSGEKADEVNRAGQALMTELENPKNKDGFRVSVILFGSTARMEVDAVPPSNVRFAMDGSSGGTRGVPALLLAKHGIETFPCRVDRRQASPVVVVMSDGGLADTAQTIQIADEMKQKQNATIICIGFGKGVDEDALKRIASSPQHYAFAEVGSLIGLFAKVGKTLTNSLQQVPGK